jgi:cob(I)alamin adenosyltransferase
MNGLLIIFTGDGKGKTSAALGMAVRALGHGFRVCMIQFVKGKWKTGEWSTLKQFGDYMEVHVKGRGFIYNPEDVARNSAAARKAWQFAREKLSSAEYRMVILDELTYLLKYGLIDRNEVCDCIRERPKDMHVVITGRDAPSCIIEMADMVTEMTEIKHPLHSGVKAQKGIEF